MAGKVLTSTVEMGRVTLVATTEVTTPTQFTRTDFLEALKKVSRRRPKKADSDRASSGT